MMMYHALGHEPEKDLSINTVGTLNVLNAALKNINKVVNARKCLWSNIKCKKETDSADRLKTNIYSAYKDNKFN